MNHRQLLTGMLAGLLLAGCAGMPHAPAPESAAAPFSIRDIFREPGLTGYAPESVQWQPAGDLLTWLQRGADGERADLHMLNLASGERGVLISADVLAGAARSPDEIKDEQERERVTRYDVASYHWSPRGDAVLFAAGDQLELFDLATRQARVITRGPGRKLDPKLSPDQRHVSYVIDGNLHVARLGQAGRPVLEPRAGVLNGWPSWVYMEELGLRSGYAWSPDSRYIAVMQSDERGVQRYPLVDYLQIPPAVEMQSYPKAGSANPVVRLAVHDVATGRTRWLPIASGPDVYLARFGWLPEGRKLYALTLDRAQREATLYLAELDAGETRVLARVTDPYWIDVADLHFLADGRFIWPNQIDGWHHLQLYSAEGEQLRNLTPGDYNVIELAGVDEESGEVFFTRYTDDGLHSQLYRATLDGGEPQPVTHEPGVHGVNMRADGRYFVETYSNATRAPRIAVKRADGTPVAVLRESPDLSAYRIIRPQFVSYTAGDGTTQLPAALLLPPGFNPEKSYPVVMYHYGGPGAGTLVRDAWGGERFLFEQLLAHEGFIVFRADNRVAGQMSHTRQGQRKHRLGEIELADQLAAVDWLKSQPYVDGDNIGLWGWSYGGYMTLYALHHAPGVWDAGISVAPVTQWEDYDTIYTERYMGTPQAQPEAYRKSSTLPTAGQLRDPLLLAHGTGDDNVHFQNIHHLVQAYVEHDVDYRLLMYPNKTHGISGEAARVHLYSAMREFWHEHLRDGK